VVHAPKEKFEYVFTIRKYGEFFGLIGLKETDKQNKKTEIGYWLSLLPASTIKSHEKGIDPPPYSPEFCPVKFPFSPI